MAHDGGYEVFAVRYDRGSTDSVHNTLLDRPAVQAACPPLAGRTVPEAGCAGGRLTATSRSTTSPCPPAATVSAWRT
ncbi:MULTISPECIES: hypothetical protein [Streptomyces]|uniref:hypothetical protein n=1 Tax=Streptomyces TaxID=1883 RepID=UPI0013B3C77B|nr:MULTISPECIES: hypothetical protein [Streptomyces]